jgi:putative ABC transport system substrate-binding protein
MRRRDLIKGIAGSTIAWPLAAHAQEVTPRLIGVLSAGSESTYRPYIGAILRGLNESGFHEGQNIDIEYRWADTKLERLPDLAADLVRRNVSLIITSGGVPPAMAAKAATSSIPIIFHMGDDPVRLGIVASVNRPGANITGVSFLTVASATKRLELLYALVPKAKTIGLLVNPENPGAGPTQDELRHADPRLQLEYRRRS